MEGCVQIQRQHVINVTRGGGRRADGQPEPVTEAGVSSESGETLTMHVE